MRRANGLTTALLIALLGTGLAVSAPAEVTRTAAAAPLGADAFKPADSAWG